MEHETRNNTARETVRHSAARWAQADKRILREVFPLLAEGRPVRVSEIVEASGSGPAPVEAALASGRAGRDSSGSVIELSGLMLSPTMHRVEIGGIALFSCCALLAQLVPALIGAPVKVESIDPVGRRIVRLTVTPEGVTAVEPAGAVATFVMTEGGSMSGDIGNYFCRHVHHFASSETARTFLEGEQRRYTLSIDELNEAAQQLYQTTWAA